MFGLKFEMQGLTKQHSMYLVFGQTCDILDLSQGLSDSLRPDPLNVKTSRLTYIFQITMAIFS